MAGKEPNTTDRSTAPVAGMHYKVLARRWRPQQFADLVGQEAIAQALQGAITAERVAHAYLFTGARGVGKTTTARILAKALNCRTGPTCTPCGNCDSCESITSGDDMDVLEIDGASNRGIDEVRELRQNANLRPTRGRYKIYIIDEVHMLTREAFNALLKTLEEPPQHVKFIFATTDPQKIPVTILSRCQRFDFGTIASDRIQKQLEEIVTSEGIAVDTEVLELLTRRAAGSMRDSLSLLDQLLAFGGERVTSEQVHRLLGTASEDRLMELVGHLLGRSVGGAIQVLDQAESHGVQLGELIDQLVEFFRDLMVLKSAGMDARLVSVSSRRRNQVVELASRLTLDFIFAATDILAETKNRLRGTNYGRILLDIALARIASLEELGSLSELAERLQVIESSLKTGAGDPRRGQTVPVFRAPAAFDSKKKPEADEPAPVVGPRRPDPATAAAAAPDATSEPPPPSRQAVPIPNPLTVENAMELIRDLSADFGPILRESITRSKLMVGPSGDTLVMYLDAMYNTAGRAKEIETALQQRVGSDLRFRVELGTAESTVAKDLTPRRSSYSERLSEATRDPLVQHAMEVFGARVMRVDES